MNYSLNMGCHRGTVASRDAEVFNLDINFQPYRNRDHVISDAKARFEDYSRLGLKLWFAKIVTLEGDEVISQEPIESLVKVRYW